MNSLVTVQSSEAMAQLVLPGLRLKKGPRPFQANWFPPEQNPFTSQTLTTCPWGREREEEVRVRKVKVHPSSAKPSHEREIHHLQAGRRTLSHHALQTWVTRAQTFHSVPVPRRAEA